MANESNREFWNTSGEDGQAGLSRTVLGALLALLALAVVLALWFLVIDGDDEAASGDQVSTAAPTPLPIPSSTPAPPTPDPGEPTAVPTPEPTATPVPDGFEACGTDRAPLVTATYIVDTIETPLNQRATASIEGELMGSFAPGETGLSFTGDCLVNLADGLVWWEINNGSADVWVASKFVTPN